MRNKIILKNRQKNTKGITLIVLVITIIILLILAGVTIALLTGENGILSKATKASNETNKQTATEIMNLKITNAQIDTYTEKQQMPTLKELSLALKDDEEIQYITESGKIASVEYSVNSDDPSKIYIKLKEYPYEFEINENLKLATIDGEKVDNKYDDTNTDNSNDDNTYNDELKSKIEEMEIAIKSVQSENTLLRNDLNKLSNMYDNLKIKNYKSGTATIPKCTTLSSATTYVKFSEPLPNTNYTISVLSTYAGTWWANTSYTALNKTVNGFTICCFNNGSGSIESHLVDWLVVPKTQ